MATVSTHQVTRRLLAWRAGGAVALSPRMPLVADSAAAWRRRGIAGVLRVSATTILRGRNFAGRFLRRELKTNPFIHAEPC